MRAPWRSSVARVDDLATAARNESSEFPAYQAKPLILERKPAKARGALWVREPLRKTRTLPPILAGGRGRRGGPHELESHPVEIVDDEHFGDAAQFLNRPLLIAPATVLSYGGLEWF